MSARIHLVLGLCLIFAAVAFVPAAGAHYLGFQCPGTLEVGHFHWCPMSLDAAPDLLDIDVLP